MEPEPRAPRIIANPYLSVFILGAFGLGFLWRLIASGPLETPLLAYGALGFAVGGAYTWIMARDYAANRDWYARHILRRPQYREIWGRTASLRVFSVGVAVAFYLIADLSPRRNRY